MLTFLVLRSSKRDWEYPRAIRYTAIPIPKYKLPEEPERLARQFTAHAPAAAASVTRASTPAATGETTEECDLRGVAADEPEEEEPDVLLPAEAQYLGARRSDAVDAGVAATLVRPRQRQAGIHHLSSEPTKKKDRRFSAVTILAVGVSQIFKHARAHQIALFLCSKSEIIRIRAMKQLGAPIFL